ncbi:MAG: nitrate- and nitrite sensing domain-containing protein [Streptosporangiaceae bacterium]
MGNHGMVSADQRSASTDNRARRPASLHFPSSQAFTLRNWPVLWRLIAVIVMALVMGLVFGGLRIGSAADSAAGFGRASQLASLGQQVTGLVQALEDERDETTGVISGGGSTTLKPWYHATNTAAARVRALAAGIDGSFPANIQASAATVRAVITPAGLGALRGTASQDALAVIADYAAPIGDMITLNDQIAQGISDPGLVNDVRTLNSLSLTKDQAAQQRAFLYNALTQQFFADGEQPALTTALSEELVDKASFETTATPAEQNLFSNTVAGPKVNEAEGIEDLILTSGALDTTPINISLKHAPAEWYSAMSSTVDDMQAVELQIAKNIVARSQVLQQGAEQSARFTAIATFAVLLLVLIATLVVARSLVMPLRRLRAGALDIATVQLPERVRQLAEAPDPATSLEVAPIDVPSSDEIGQVARAFDQVHSEAVRLAGNEAMLRSSFNAMFVNLSRRSQSLIERLARTIDSLEQNEEDPDRLSALFAMDHMVTRMRRNSENLLLLAGHESARKWSEPVSLADVIQAATAEIEQYQRVTLNIQPGVAVSGHAVSDVVHLLAEIIENATVFSPKDTRVRVSAQQLTNGGVLIEVSDNGVGVSEARMAEMNRRLDNPPVIDESVSRHMGLFAVAHLAERHGARIRLRPGSPGGLTALVWLPDSLIERAIRPFGGWAQPPAAGPGVPGGWANGRHAVAVSTDTNGQSAGRPFVSKDQAGRAGAFAGPAPAGPGRSAPVQPAGPPASNWFRSRQPSAGSAGHGGRPPAAAPRASGPVRSDSWAEGRHAAQIIADPVRGDRTVAGLPVRVPQANLIRGSAGGGRRADSGVPGRPAASHQAQRPAQTPAQTPAGTGPQRSPEMARSLLSGFQRGAHRAEGEGRPPATGEGADR